MNLIEFYNRYNQSLMDILDSKMVYLWITKRCNGNEFYIIKRNK